MLYTDTTLDGPDTQTRGWRLYSARGSRTGRNHWTHTHTHTHTHKTIPPITSLVTLYSYCPVRRTTCWFRPTFSTVYNHIYNRQYAAKEDNQDQSLGPCAILNMHTTSQLLPKLVCAARRERGSA